MHRLLFDCWARPSWPLRLLWPVSKLYEVAVAGRRRYLSSRAQALSVPVIIVGNITWGGTGKTPLVLWLAQQLQAAGWQPGIISRGYGGTQRNPQRVAADANTARVGDEALMMARRLAGCVPVVVARRRTSAAQALIAQGCDVIISDDGLQHYNLARDVEIAVIDGTRSTGNGWCCPAGPLREPLARLSSVDFKVVNGGDSQDAWQMAVTPSSWLRLPSWENVALSDPAAPSGRVHAVAGIGNPARFFASLRELGLEPLEHPFPDHHNYHAQELCFDETLDLVMTEKDAVKCQHLMPAENGTPTYWCLRVDACLPDAFTTAVLNKIEPKQR